jgi:hypothetical protein
MKTTGAAPALQALFSGKSGVSGLTGLAPANGGQDLAGRLALDQMQETSRNHPPGSLPLWFSKLFPQAALRGEAGALDFSND